MPETGANCMGKTEHDRSSGPTRPAETSPSVVSRLMIDFDDLCGQVADRYRSCGRVTRSYVAGRLRRDPVMQVLLAEPGYFGDVLDIGCGRGPDRSGAPCHRSCPLRPRDRLQYSASA